MARLTPDGAPERLVDFHTNCRCSADVHTTVDAQLVDGELRLLTATTAAQRVAVLATLENDDELDDDADDGSDDTTPGDTTPPAGPPGDQPPGDADTTPPRARGRRTPAAADA